MMRQFGLIGSAQWYSKLEAIKRITLKKFKTPVNDPKIGELESLKAQVLFHPTFYDFEIRYADGNAHRFEYVIEAGNHPDDRYGRLVSECEKFFEIK